MGSLFLIALYKINETASILHIHMRLLFAFNLMMARIRLKHNFMFFSHTYAYCGFGGLHQQLYLFTISIDSG